MSPYKDIRMRRKVAREGMRKLREKREKEQSVLEKSDGAVNIGDSAGGDSPANP